ncbi:DHA2 family efflux MFS transporter permease subunit [Nocardioides sp. BP30]|uniref:DHA2 family efflux MFS transporter permease subunit n=1 Tax=Nocardioides sp. BP30 TaxID=3036374 RepID=UPI0024691660|nr:DHA2 family efflux MFS transporter permease subunit [Nocardioides sp. BP30]WGL50794.1 DHA2 family efflux MFS transporter permease subunit [Nocardioides sp. BP30]
MDKTRQRRRISARTAAATAYVTSMTLASLDSHVVNIMLPTLTHDFHSSLGSVKWTVLVYVLAMAIALPVAPWLSGRFGERRVFIGATLGFALASAACGAAQSLEQLVSFRVLQGIGGGLVGPLATAMLYRTYPQSERPRITRLLLVPIALGPALAPPLGGFLVEHLSWHVAFYLNIPIGLLTVSMVWVGLDADDGNERLPLNVGALVTAGLALGGTIYVLGKGPEDGWSDPLVLTTAAVAVAAMARFVTIEWSTPHPLLGITLLREPVFRFSNIATMLQTVGWLGGLYYVTPLVLQDVGSHSPLVAGLVLTCIPLGVIISTQTVARAHDQIGPRMLTMVGQGGLAAALVVLATFDGATPLWRFCLTVFCAGVFNGMAMVSLQASMFTNIPDSALSQAATILNVNRQASTALGAGIATAIIAAGAVGGGLADVTYYQAAFLVAAVASLGAGAAAIALPGRAAPVLSALVEPAFESTAPVPRAPRW